MTVAEATATFGRPARTYRYGEYVIMILLGSPERETSSSSGGNRHHTGNISTR